MTKKAIPVRLLLCSLHGITPYVQKLMRSLDLAPVVLLSHRSKVVNMDCMDSTAATEFAQNA